MIMILMIIPLLFTSWIASAHADPLYSGLPDSLPAEVLTDPAFIEFQQAPNSSGSPLGSRITFEGELIGTPEKRRDLFLEKFIATLPLHTHILVSQDSRSRDVWNYPVGTRVAHWIRFKSTGQETFELRLSEKLAGGNWAMGSYSPRVGAAGDSPLFLNRYLGTPEFSIQITRASDQLEGELHLNRINNQSCQACHFVQSGSQYQFQHREEAGPCGFGPMNPNIAGDWANRYRQSRGESPFESR